MVHADMGRAILALVIGAVCGITATLYLFPPHPYAAKEIVFPDASSLDMGRFNDANGQSLAYVYGHADMRDAQIAKALTLDEASSRHDRLRLRH
jgi:hypothetical protein